MKSKQIALGLLALACAGSANAFTLGENSLKAPVKAEGARMVPSTYKAETKEAYTTIKVNEPVYSLPEGGNTILYARDAQYFYDNGAAVFFGYDTAYATTVTFYENGDVYIKNPISGFPTDSYIIGKQEGDEIVVKLPQTIAVVSTTIEVEGQKVPYVMEYNVNRMYYKDVEDAVGNIVGMDYVLDPTKTNEIRFTVNEKGIVMERDAAAEQDMMPDVLMGVTFNDYTDGEVWAPYGDCNQVYYIFDEEPRSLPEGAEASRWIWSYWQEFGHYNMDYRYVNVYVNPEQTVMYLGCLYPGMEDSYIIGQIHNGTVTFESGQYLGLNQATNHYAYFVAGDKKSEPMSDGIMSHTLVWRSSLDFEYNADDEDMFSDHVLIINNGHNDAYEIRKMVEPTAHYQAARETANPQKPTFSFDTPADYGGDWFFNIPKFDVNNNLLDTSRMYYRIFVDDSPYLLYADEYPGMEADTYWIPYDFDNRANIMVNGTFHQVSHYMKSYKTVTVESMYEDEDGNQWLSGQVGVWDSVNELENAEVVKRESYDLQGRRSDLTMPGVHIVCETLGNGTVRSRKTIVK